MICLELQFFSPMWALGLPSPEELCEPQWPWLTELFKNQLRATKCWLVRTSCCVLWQTLYYPNRPKGWNPRQKTPNGKGEMYMKNYKAVMLYVRYSYSTTQWSSIINILFLPFCGNVNIGLSRWLMFDIPLSTTWPTESPRHQTRDVLTSPRSQLPMSAFHKSSLQLSSLKTQWDGKRSLYCFTVTPKISVLEAVTPPGGHEA